MKTYVSRPVKVKAIQWKGWPHKIKGLVPHPIYPQLATLSQYVTRPEIYATDWIVKNSDGTRIMHDFEFKEQFYEQR